MSELTLLHNYQLGDKVKYNSSPFEGVLFIVVDVNDDSVKLNGKWKADGSPLTLKNWISVEKIEPYNSAASKNLTNQVGYEHRFKIGDEVLVDGVNSGWFEVVDFTPENVKVRGDFEYQQGVTDRWVLPEQVKPFVRPERPPLGLIRRSIHDEQRRDQILAAMDRFIEAGKAIPTEWITEYNEIVVRYQKN